MLPVWSVFITGPGGGGRGVWRAAGPGLWLWVFWVAPRLGLGLLFSAMLSREEQQGANIPRAALLGGGHGAWRAAGSSLLAPAGELLGLASSLRVVCLSCDANNIGFVCSAIFSVIVVLFVLQLSLLRSVVHWVILCPVDSLYPGSGRFASSGRWVV